MPRSLTGRLIASTVAWLLVALAAGGFALSLAFRRAVEGSFEQRLDSLMLTVIGAIEVPPDGPARLAGTIADPRFDRAYSGWYWQVDDGETRLRSRSLWDAVLPVDLERFATPQASLRVAGPRDEPLRVLGRTLTYPSRARPILAAVAAPEAELREEIDRFDRLLAIALGALGVGLAAAVAIQVGYGLRPLRRLAAELAGVRAGRSARLDDAYPSEIQPLVRAMNEVLDHDARLIERARTHVGDLAHGLKTPLAVLAAETSSGTSGSPQRVAEQVATMTRMVNHHLTRAAAAGSRQVLGARTEVAAVVAALRATLLRLHADRRLALETAVRPDAVFAGERQDLEEMLGNLMDNACKWAAGTVVVRSQRVDARLQLTIDDDGPGLSAEEAGLALGRGTRLDEDEPGSGLGLSIAADLAGLYGGALTLGRSDLGGLRARLELPAA
jgi:signal transduction histidine kinase